MVEVDPSDSAVESSPFFFLQTSPAERNYNVGNNELLAVLMALQEWQQ